ncbi:MAG: M13 family metallopeptidase [Muribaculaceae bacterium]|nr:M13 family metallopeptidase [Muribaculaceae bacterium]
MKTNKIALAIAVAAGISFNAMAEEHLKSLNADYIDNSIPLGTDFYRHVNRGWQGAHPLTAEYSRYGQFNVLSDESERRVKEIVTNLAATNPEPGTVAYKVANLYSLAMDSVRRNTEGAAPIKADLKKIEDARHEDMPGLLMWMHAKVGNPFFAAGPMEDMANSNEYAMYISGARLGMGDRDYYLSEDAENLKIRKAYEKLIETQMRNAGYSARDAKRIVKNVMKIEKSIAEETWTREQSRNIPAMYNPRTIEQIKELYPAVDWDRYFIETMGINTPEQVIVTQLNTVQRGNDLITSLTDREIKDYYLWKYVSQAASKLSDNFTDAAFEFNKVVSGVQEQRPRWKRALSATEGAMGEAIGQLYVEKYFPESSKEYMLDLVENLRGALGKHLINLPWMSTDTKMQALKKLNAFTVKIGYPDKWLDYTTLEIDPSKSYYENRHTVEQWHQAREYAKWGKPVDKTEWGMTPQTVNAYYNPMANEIVFPAGILQAPFFDPEASDAENYGGIGVVIGHEMTHGFDDQGRNFDASGNLADWWTPADAEAFEALTNGLVNQFNAVEVLPGLNANGQYTLGENIADQGGLRISRTAFLDSQAKKGIDAENGDEKIDGFTPMQVFYMNYANIWAANTRPEEKRNRTMSDVHSLPENRVNVTLRNITPFFKAFGITPGDALYLAPEEQVVIW